MRVVLGHSVRSVTEATRIVAGDVESATQMLDARHLAGDEDLVAELRAGVGAAWRAGLPAALDWLRRDAASRRERFGDVAFAVEPHLKAGAGGLRETREGPLCGFEASRPRCSTTSTGRGCGTRPPRGPMCARPCTGVDRA